MLRPVSSATSVNNANRVARTSHRCRDGMLRMITLQRALSRAENGGRVTRYVALLRGVNVGGKRSLPMADLRALAESLGLAEVATYIQSGNLLFSSATP